MYLTSSLGPYGMWVIVLPVSVGFLWGVDHFAKLEEAKDKCAVVETAMAQAA